MLLRQKEVLQEWLDSELRAKQEAKKLESETSYKQLVDKLGSSWWEWKNRQKDDVEYLKKEGALQVFKDAKRILDKRFYLRNHVGIIKPTDTDPQVEAYLELLYSIDSKLVAPHTEFPYLWTARQVLCFVARDEGQPIGFRLGGVDEILPNKTFLGRGLIEAIKTAPTVNFKRKHWRE